MKKIIVLSLVGLFLLSGCSHTNDLGLEVANHLTIYEMEDFNQEITESVIEIDNEELIEEIVNILNSAHKQTGSVDIRIPDYRMDLNEDSVFLWLDDNSGTVMSVEDTETIYSISSKGRRRLIEIIGER